MARSRSGVHLADTVTSPTAAAATTASTNNSTSAVSGSGGGTGNGSGSGSSRSGNSGTGGGGGSVGNFSASRVRGSGPAVGRARSDTAVVEIVSIPEETAFDALPPSALPSASASASAAAAAAADFPPQPLRRHPPTFLSKSSRAFSAATPGGRSSADPSLRHPGSAAPAIVAPPGEAPHPSALRQHPPAASPSRSPSRASSSASSSSRAFSFAAARDFFSGRLPTLARRDSDRHQFADATRPLPDAAAGAGESSAAATAGGDSDGGAAAAAASREASERCAEWTRGERGKRGATGASQARKRLSFRTCAAQRVPPRGDPRMTTTTGCPRGRRRSRSASGR
ncbi:hypothetical protein CLOM_g17264 [Closterium sp. NIES-68]|nr:hypothetical protein CLOM_g17264 [Closterium sp. NIES-68]